MGDAVSRSTVTADGRVQRALVVLLSIAVAVSVIHYADNYFNYEAYPQSPTGPNPSATLILVAWFVFTGLGVAGYLRFRRKADGLAILLLGLYAGSGLVGLGHYTVPGALNMPWWRHAHVIADIGCGVAVLGFALWALRRRRISPASSRTDAVDGLVKGPR